LNCKQNLAQFVIDIVSILVY